MNTPLPAQPYRTLFFSQPIWRWTLLATLGAGLLIALISAYFYREARDTANKNLSVIAELKAHEIERWLLDKRNSTIQPPSGVFAQALQTWQKAAPGAQRDAVLRETLGFLLRRHPEVDRIDLYDSQGRFAIGSAPGAPDQPSLSPHERAPAADKLSQLIDFYRSADAQAYLGILTPLKLNTPEGPRDSGIVRMRLDPARYLYPFIQTWPDSSVSGETLIFRLAGDEVEFVNPLRNSEIPPLSLRIPLSALDLTPEKLQTDRTVLAPGHDYRKIKILRAIHPVTSTPWRIIAKIDAAEVYAPALRNSLIVAGLLLGLVIALTQLLRQGHERSLQRATLAQEQAAAQRLSAFIEAVPETLFMVSRDGRIELINQTGAARLGSTPGQLIGSNIFEHLPAELIPARRVAIEQACTGSQPVSLTDRRGEIEFLSMFYPLGDGEHAVVIASDITRRNADARALQAATDTLQGFIDHLPGTAYVKDHESRVLIANRRFLDLLGLDPADMIGKRSSEIFPGEFGEQIVADDLRVLANGQTEVIEESFGGRFYESTKFSIPHEGGPPQLGGITLDVTTRHQAEEALRQSEENLRRLSDNLPDGFLYQIAQEPDGSRHILYISSGVERLLGIKPAALMADLSLYFQRVDPAQMQALRDEQARALDTEFHMDVHMQLADGRWGWINMHSRRRPGLNEHGQIIWDGVATDVTRQLHDEVLLNLQARRASALLEMPALAEALDEKAFLSHAQDLAEELTGSQIAFIHFVNDDQESIELAAWSQNTLAHYCTAAFDKHYPISQAGIWADAARQKTPVVINDYASAQGKHGLPEGHSHLQRLISVPVLEGGQVRMMAGVGNKPDEYSDTDVESVLLIANEAWRIVRKQRAERELAQSVQVIEASPAVCFRWRAEEGWPVVYVSENVRRWGYEPDDLLAARPAFAAMIHPDDLPRIGAEVSEHLAAGRNAYTQEYRLLQTDGTALWVSDLTHVIRDEQGRPLFIDGVVTDISERKANEIKLAENLAAQQTLNKKLEEAHNQLLQAEKLSAIGQLAAGVAHELNNPIGFVHSNLGTLAEYVSTLINLCDTYTTTLEDTQPDCPQLTEIRRIKQDQDYNYLRGDIFPLLEESREGLARVRKIVQDLRDFSRTGNQDWVLADLHKGLDATLNIVANELKYKCTVRKEYGELPEVFCVISQINQVFMNLLVNAAQAIETEGEIVLKSGLEGDDQVWISISDTGSGIEPDKLNRIFEPFFTTKPVGVGTGLGLSLVFGIVNRHHGRIEVSSQPGKGTTFRIVLPINQPANPEAT